MVVGGGWETHSHWLHLTGGAILIGCTFYRRAGAHSHWLEESRDAYFGRHLRENSLGNEWNASKISLLKRFHSLSCEELWDPAEKVTKITKYYLLPLSQWSNGRW